MTNAEFFEAIQDYYGNYQGDGKLLSYVKAYIKRDIDEEKLKTLFRFITYSHPVNYGPPDIAAIEGAIIWGLKYQKGADVHKSRVIEKTVEHIELTAEERQAGNDLLMVLKGQFKGMSLGAREAAEFKRDIMASIKSSQTLHKDST